MSFARTATGLRSSPTNFLASRRISIMLLSTAKSGANGNDATNNVTKPNWITAHSKNKHYTQLHNTLHTITNDNELPLLGGLSHHSGSNTVRLTVPAAKLKCTFHLTLGLLNVITLTSNTLTENETITQQQFHIVCLMETWKQNEYIALNEAGPLGYGYIQYISNNVIGPTHNGGQMFDLILIFILHIENIITRPQAETISDHYFTSFKM